MSEHGIYSLPVPMRVFVSPVVDGASGREFIVMGTVSQVEGTDDTTTTAFGLPWDLAGVLAATVALRIGAQAFTAAYMQVMQDDAVKRGRMEAEREMHEMRESQARHPSSSQDEGETGSETRGEDEGEFPRIPPSAEVVEQMIKDDRDRGKDSL